MQTDAQQLAASRLHDWCLNNSLCTLAEHPLPQRAAPGGQPAPWRETLTAVLGIVSKERGQCVATLQPVLAQTQRLHAASQPGR